MNKFNNIVI